MFGLTALKKKENSILRSFPSPEFLTMSAVGVDISDQSIKFLELNSSEAQKTPVVFGEERLEKGIVVGGEIRDIEKLAQALKAVSKKANNQFVRASLPEQKAYFFTTEVPRGSSREQILKVLEFKLEEHVPLSPAEAVVDYDYLSPHKDSSNDHISVGVTVYPKETVENYTNAFLRADLLPLSLEIEAQAIARSVVLRADMGTYMIVDFGETSTGLSIVSGGNLGFTSTLDVAGSQITAIISEELGTKGEGVLNIKNTVGLSGDTRYTALNKKLIEEVGKLGEEIKRHQSYWGTREKMGDEKSKNIERIILCGGNANLKGLPEYLEQVLKMPVARANVWGNAFSFDEYIPTMQYGPSLTYATAIGLALRNST